LSRPPGYQNIAHSKRARSKTRHRTYRARGARSAECWSIKIAAAFSREDGLGFSIELKAIPLDGRLVALPPAGNDERK